MTVNDEYSNFKTYKKAPLILKLDIKQLVGIGIYSYHWGGYPVKLIRAIGLDHA